MTGWNRALILLDIPRRWRGSAIPHACCPPGPLGPGYTPRPPARPDPAAETGGSHRRGRIPADDGGSSDEFRPPVDDSLIGRALAGQPQCMARRPAPSFPGGFAGSPPLAFRNGFAVSPPPAFPGGFTGLPPPAPPQRVCRVPSARFPQRIRRVPATRFPRRVYRAPAARSPPTGLPGPRRLRRRRNVARTDRSGSADEFCDPSSAGATEMRACAKQFGS